MTDTTKEKEPSYESEKKETSIEQIIQGRKQKAKQLKNLGFLPFSNGFAPTHFAFDIKKDYDLFSKEELEPKNIITKVAGRILSIRSFGKAAFLVIQDASGQIQCFVHKNGLTEKLFAVFKLADIGDFVGV